MHRLDDGGVFFCGGGDEADEQGIRLVSGGTLITLNKDSSVNVEQIPFERNLYREKVAKRRVKR